MPKPCLAATVVFDLDGTIADTAPDLIDAANAALIAGGFAAAPPEAIRKAVGLGARAMVEAGLAAAGHDLDAGRVRQLAAGLVAHYEMNIAAKTCLFPGFAEAAGSLRLEGAKLALCTNKQQRLTLKLLEALGIAGLFDAVTCGDSFPFRKPDPRHVESAVSLAGGDLFAAVMVGDSEPDIAAAKAAGIPAIAVSFGYASVPARELGAGAVMNSFEELPGLIRAVFAPAVFL